MEIYPTSAPPAATPLSGRQIFAGLLFVVAVDIASFFVVLIIPPGFLEGGLSPLVISLFIVILEALLIIPPWFFLVRRSGSWDSLGLRGFRPRDLALGCSLLVLSFLFNIAWAIFLAQFGLEVQPDILPLFGGGGMGFMLALVIGGVLAPLAEEIYFRGFLFAGLREHWGLGWGLISSSVLFALFHFLPTSMPPVFLLGLIFSLIYQLSGSLWPSILMHAAINTLAVLCSYLTAPI